MSDQQATPETGTPDTLSDIVWAVLGVAVGAVVVAIVLPLLVPAIVVALLGHGIARKAGFWRVWRWAWVASTLGVLLVLALLAYEAVQLGGWIGSGEAAATFDGHFWQGVQDVWPQLWPWLLVNLAAGVLLVPVALTMHRRRIAERVRKRRLADVQLQTEVESARHRAADPAAARRIGVHVDPKTGKITGTTATAVRAPHTVAGRRAFGVASRPTIRTGGDLWKDKRSVRDWLTRDGRWLSLPERAGAMRVIMLGESGAGKTVLINDWIGCAVADGWPVVFYDAKGNPADAAATAAVVRTLGGTAAIAPRWNFFQGTSAEVTAKLMRLIPVTQGDGSFYRDETLGVLQAVQYHSPIRSITDMRERLMHPEGHTGSDYDTQLVTKPVTRDGDTAGSRALARLMTVLRPLQPWIAENEGGWSYDQPAADVTIVPLSPVDEAQVRLGDVMLMDLRNHLSARMRNGDTSPLLVIVDEFPQLVTDGRDPADTAGSLFEVARSADVGLVIAAQSPAGLSPDERMRARALTSGAALVFGRSKDPEGVVSYAGTVERMEASGDAEGAGLGAGRSQHTWVIPPQAVREASDGQFWLVQAGGWAQFRALPTIHAAADTAASTPQKPTAPARLEQAPVVPVDATPAEPAPAPEPAPLIEPLAQFRPRTIDDE